MKTKITEKINVLERSLFRSCERLSNSFSTKDGNEVIKTTLKINTLKNVLNDVK